jgi:Flp pilus assembly protein TadB
MPVMTVAAPIVAILAFIAAAFSARYTLDFTRTERDKRLEERAPKIAPRLRQVPGH